MFSVRSRDRHLLPFLFERTAGFRRSKAYCLKTKLKFSRVSASLMSCRLARPSSRVVNQRYVISVTSLVARVASWVVWSISHGSPQCCCSEKPLV